MKNTSKKGGNADGQLKLGSVVIWIIVIIVGGLIAADIWNFAVGVFEKIGQALTG